MAEDETPETEGTSDAPPVPEEAVSLEAADASAPEAPPVSDESATPAGEAPAEDEAPAEESAPPPEEEQPPEAASEPETEAAPEAEAAPAAAPAEAEAPAATAQPAEALSPKERRRRARAEKAAAVPSREPRTPDERQTERQADRARKRELRRKVRLRQREKARTRQGGATAPQPEARRREPGRPKTRQGVVVSDRAAKTITVRIDTARRHRRYEKIVRTSHTIHAHDEQGEAHIGDTVIVRECRPLSRTKRWRLERVVERAA